MGRSKFTMPERFWTKVDKTPGHGPKGDCWPFTGGRDENGYGRFYFEGRSQPANRVALKITAGLADNMKSCHTCDFPPCCRPEHLFPGTDADNMADRDRKGRGGGHKRRGENSGARRHPERLARGERSGAHTHPERMPRGSRHGNAKLTETDVIAIRSSTEPLLVLASRYGVTKSVISHIRTRRSWRHVP